MDDSNSADSDSPSVILDASVDLCVPSGRVSACTNVERADENDETERVGVLDYMPSYNRRSLDAKCSGESPEDDSALDQSSDSFETFKNGAKPPTSCDRDIELKTFSITECCGDVVNEFSSFHDTQRSAPASSDDDDELLVPAGADVEDALQEIVVHSEQATYVQAPSNHATSVSFAENWRTRGTGRASAADREIATLFRRFPSSFSVMRDAAWSNPDIARTSPINSPEPVEKTVPDTSKSVSYSVSSPRADATEMGLADRFEKHGQSSSRDQSPVDEHDKNPSVRLGGNASQPVETLSVDRSTVDSNPVSRPNVVFLNDYAFWPNTRNLCSDDSSAVAERSEVEKRQERRDKRKKKKTHALHVAFAEDVAGYVGEGKTIEELIDYITKTDGKDRLLRQKTPKHGRRQNESKKPLMATKSLNQTQTSKMKLEPSKMAAPRISSDVASSFDEPGASGRVESSGVALPGSDSAEMVTVNDGGLQKSIVVNTTESHNSKDVASASEGAKSRRRKKSHKTLQRVDDAETGDISREKSVDGSTRICPGISTEPVFQSYPDPSSSVKDTLDEKVNSSMQQRCGLDDGAGARTKAVVDMDSFTASDGSLMQADNGSTDLKNPSASTFSSVEMTHRTEKETMISKEDKSVAMDMEAFTRVPSSLNDRHEPVTTSFPVAGAALVSECSYIDKNALLLDEDEPWEEFQSKRKRSRNRTKQLIVKNSTPSTRRSSSSGAMMAVAPLKDAVSDLASSASSDSSGAIRNGADLCPGQKFTFIAGNFPKTARKGQCDGSVQRANVANCLNVKLCELVGDSLEAPHEPSNNSHLGNNISASNRLGDTGFSVPEIENTTGVVDSNCLSCVSQVSPNTGSLLKSGPKEETVSCKNMSAAGTSYDLVSDFQTKKLSNLDFLSEAVWKENEVGITKMQQTDKKFDSTMGKCVNAEALDEKSNLSKGSLVSGTMTRPAVVFCGKADSQFGEDSYGISFEFSDDLAIGRTTSSLPSNNIATSPIVDKHISSIRFHQASKSSDVASSGSGGVNCGRPIAPLSGHASLTKTPVLVVSPLPKVSQEEETVGCFLDTDPETLKEATIAATNARRAASGEAKETALRISVSSVMTGPPLGQDLAEREELVTVDGGVIEPHSLQLKIETMQRWSTLSHVLMNVDQKKTHLKQNHTRCTRPLQTAGKALTFNALEAARYLTIDWEKLLDDDSVIYYRPEEEQ